MSKASAAGWIRLYRSKSWHYLDPSGDKTLCHNYMAFDYPSFEFPPSGDRICKACRKALDERKARMTATSTPEAENPAQTAADDPMKRFLDQGYRDYQKASDDDPIPVRHDAMSSEGIAAIMGEADGDDHASTRGAGIARMIPPILSGPARFIMFPDEIQDAAYKIAEIKPGISVERTAIVKDAMGHLIRALRAAERRITELENQDVLKRAEVSAATSLLLDVQQECIQWRKRAEALETILKDQGAGFDWVEARIAHIEQRGE